MKQIYKSLISIFIILTLATVVIGTTIDVGDSDTKDISTQDTTDIIDSDIAYGVNLVKNGGFETVNPSNPSRPLYWGTYRTGWTGQFKYPEPGRTLGGKSIGAYYPSRENDKITDWTQNIYIDPSQKYRLTGWMKTSYVSEYGGAYIALDWKDSNGKYIGTSTIARRIGTTGWTFYEGIFKPMPGSSSATIILGISDSSGKAWFDDITFRTANTY